MLEGSRSGAGAGSIPLTNGSGSGRPKNTWIRLDPDPDPHHWKGGSHCLVNGVGGGGTVDSKQAQNPPRMYRKVKKLTKEKLHDGVSKVWERMPSPKK
jgi:hypothetical protein